MSRFILLFFILSSNISFAQQLPIAPMTVTQPLRFNPARAADMGYLAIDASGSYSHNKFGEHYFSYANLTGQWTPGKWGSLQLNTLYDHIGFFHAVSTQVGYAYAWRPQDKFVVAIGARVGVTHLIQKDAVWVTPDTTNDPDLPPQGNASGSTFTSDVGFHFKWEKKLYVDLTAFQLGTSQIRDINFTYVPHFMLALGWQEWDLDKVKLGFEASGFTDFRSWTAQVHTIATLFDHWQVGVGYRLGPSMSILTGYTGKHMRFTYTFLLGLADFYAYGWYQHHLTAGFYLPEKPPEKGEEISGPAHAVTGRQSVFTIGQLESPHTSRTFAP